MHGLALMIAATAMGVDYGWTVRDDGQTEYIIQIEPTLIELLKAGESVTSEVDPRVTNVRRFRIEVGTQPLPRELPATAMRAASPPLLEMEQENSSRDADDDRWPNSAPSMEAQFDLAPHSSVPPVAAGGGDTIDADIPNLIPLPNDDLTGGGPATDGSRVREARFDTMRQDDPARQSSDEQSTDPLHALGHPAETLQVEVPTAEAPEPDERAMDATTDNSPENEESLAQAAPSPPPSPRWLPLTITLVALFASIGLNVYLGWTTWDTYHRYQALVAELPMRSHGLS